MEVYCFRKIDLTKEEATIGLISVILRQIRPNYEDYNTNHTTGRTTELLLAPIASNLSAYVFYSNLIK